MRWFDRWLRGVENGVDTEPAVRICVMGGGSGQRNAAGCLEHGGHWRQAATWPLPETRFTHYYCHSDGLISPAAHIDTIGWFRETVAAIYIEG